VKENAKSDAVLRAFFESSLDEASRTEEPVGFDEVAAYVDGRLDDIDREIFESRLSYDPALRAEVADLTAMRAAMARPASAGAAAPSNVRPFRVRGAGSKSTIWILGALAMAAGLTATVVWFAQTTQRRSAAAPVMIAQGQPSTSSTPSTTTPQPAPPRIALQDNGGIVALDAAGALSLSKPAAALPDALKQDAIAALNAGTLPQPTLPRDVRSGGPLTLMGEAPTAAKFAVLEPIATLVRDARPTFRWQAHPRARGYTVAIFNDRLEPVASSGQLTAATTTWAPIVDLKPGTTYQWQVTAVLPNGQSEPAPAPPLPEARFRVLSAAQRDTLDHQLAEAGDSNLLRGLVFTHAGVLDEAEHAFAELSAANPTSDRARDLLASVRKLRGAPATTPR